MKPCLTQFGVHENTASSRPHASRLAVDARSNAIPIEEENPPIPDSLPLSENLPQSFANSLHAAPHHAATGGDETTLLTVAEIAEAFRVPVSWVYERTRKRGQDCLPHIKLGKYLRFELNAVREWLSQQRHA